MRRIFTGSEGDEVTGFADQHHELAHVIRFTRLSRVRRPSLRGEQGTHRISAVIRKTTREYYVQ